MRTKVARLFFLRALPFFRRHIFEFARLEHSAALFAFDVFLVGIPRHNLHLRMLARFGAGFLACGLRRLAGHHSVVGDCGFSRYEPLYKGGVFKFVENENLVELAVFWDGPVRLSSPKGSVLSGAANSLPGHSNS